MCIRANAKKHKLEWGGCPFFFYCLILGGALCVVQAGNGRFVLSPISTFRLILSCFSFFRFIRSFIPFISVLRIGMVLRRKRLSEYKIISLYLVIIIFGCLYGTVL